MDNGSRPLPDAGGISVQSLESFWRRMPERRAKALIEVMSKRQSFVMAIRTALGQELLEDVVKRQAEIIELIYENKSTPEEHAEMSALKKIQERWENKINAYIKTINEIRKAEPESESK